MAVEVWYSWEFNIQTASLPFFGPSEYLLLSLASPAAAGKHTIIAERENTAWIKLN